MTSEICQNRRMRVRLIVLCSIAWVCAAQTATISGIVTDALTHLPLQGSV